MADETDALTLRAERTRNHLTELVDSLQNQITPAELVGQLVGRRASNGRGPGLTEMLTAQVSRNPMACMLIAAGIGWLMLSERAEKNRPMRRVRTEPTPRRTAIKRRRSRKTSK
jgi:hypothetical protein